MFPLRYTPSQADVHVFKGINEASLYPNVTRWYTHVKSYVSEHASLPGSSTAGEAFFGASAPAAAEGDDDDEVDLFGSDDEEDAEAERVKAERIAAYNVKKSAKPKTIAKVRPSVFCVLRSPCNRHLCLCIYVLNALLIMHYVVRRDVRGEALG